MQVCLFQSQTAGISQMLHDAISFGFGLGCQTSALKGIRKLSMSGVSTELQSGQTPSESIDAAAFAHRSLRSSHLSDALARVSLMQFISPQIYCIYYHYYFF